MRAGKGREKAEQSEVHDPGSGTGPRGARRTCLICLEEKLTTDFHSLLNCGHRFCGSCLASYISIRILDGQFMRLPCPSCGLDISGDEASQLVPPSTAEKYKQFLRLRCDRNARNCPQCGWLQTGKPSHPSMECERETCRYRFCFVHGDAHSSSNISCASYAKSIRKNERLTQQWVKKNTKQCRRCGMPVEKSERQTCNHMQCVCGYNFCWLCGREYSQEKCNNLFSHYSYWNPFGCPGLQFKPNASKATVWASRAGLLAISPVVLLAVTPAYLVRRHREKNSWRRFESAFSSRTNVSVSERL
mmetsp:Transcript_9166/g.15702  ORF Transcript_9166/g.15702 Transcript_9166/m.15702 type:complete len:303 (+) Transcript_9166:98-1006(+)